MKFLAVLVADLVYGDCGKGGVIDFLTRSLGAKVVVRYNGGPQAGHNVVESSGRRHVFSSFSSGTFIPGVKTFLSPYMLISPLAMLKENRHLENVGVFDALERTYVDEKALIITPYHQAMNRLRELSRGASRHGSCGLGIGETMSDHLLYGDAAVFARDLVRDLPSLRAKLCFVRQVKLHQLEEFRARLPETAEVVEELKILDDEKALSAIVEVYAHFASRTHVVRERDRKELLSASPLLFEGAQGVLLDEWYGFHPHTTWSSITYKNAKSLLQGSSFEGEVVRLGLLRSYATRHGAGPFVTEDMYLTSALHDENNVTGPWQGSFRVGYLDLVAAKYALDVAGGADFLGVTCIDHLDELPEWKICTAYQYTGNSQNLSDYFVMKGGFIVGIKFHEERDLGHQERLTGFLKKCEPVYTVLRKKDWREYICFIEDFVKVPVGVVSYGKTADEKECSALWERKLDRMRDLA